MGDKYMAVSGLPEPCADQALCIARLALDMMDLSMQVAVDGISVVGFPFSMAPQIDPTSDLDSKSPIVHSASKLYTIIVKEETMFTSP